MFLETTPTNAPSHSLKDSNVNSKVKSEERVRVHSLINNTPKVKRACWSSGMGTRMSDKWINYSHKLTQAK